MSAGIPWTISYDFVISILFGSDLYVGPTLQITDVRSSPEDCRKVAPLVGQRVQLLLTGAN
jgi:hypothetical protein